MKKTESQDINKRERVIMATKETKITYPMPEASSNLAGTAGTTSTSNQADAASSNFSAGTTSVRRVINEEVMLNRKGYTLGLMLGEGSYASVYACQLSNNRGKCAMKIINRKKAPKDFLEKFLPREVKILTQVQHKNIVKCFDIFDTGNNVQSI